MMSMVRALKQFAFAVATLVFLGVGAGCLPGGGDEEGARARGDEVRERFPSQAEEVLQAAESFAATARGFELGAPEGAETWRSVSVTLPKASAEAIRFLVSGGFEVRVREIGAVGSTSLSENAASHARTGGSSFWSAAPGGVEEWLRLDAGVVRSDRPVAEWEIDGGALRQAGEVVEIVDEAGIPRLRVAAPRAYAAGGRPVLARLAVEGTRIELFVEANGEEILVDPSWTAAGSMGVGRYLHTATLLGNGKVLVTGGRDINSANLSSAELYDAGTNTWSAAPSMTDARYGHTATLLGNGKVLVTGGLDSSGALSSAELYDAGTNTWSAAPSMITARYVHTATLLGDGKVLVTGGISTSGVLLWSAELYDAGTNTWSAALPMITARHNHTATLLGNGKVLVTGGKNTIPINSGALKSAELYDTVTNTWSGVPDMTHAHYGHTATLLGNGKVLVTGGNNNGVLLSSAELYDAGTNTWSAAPSMTDARYRHTATLLGNGRLLVTGGPLSSAELYGGMGTWHAAPSMTDARAAHTATLLGNGKVLVAGGINNGVLSSAELFQQ